MSLPASKPRKIRQRASHHRPALRAPAPSGTARLDCSFSLELDDNGLPLERKMSTTRVAPRSVRCRLNVSCLRASEGPTPARSRAIARARGRRTSNLRAPTRAWATRDSPRATALKPDRDAPTPEPPPPTSTFSGSRRPTRSGQRRHDAILNPGGEIPPRPLAHDPRRPAPKTPLSTRSDSLRLPLVRSGSTPIAGSGHFCLHSCAGISASATCPLPCAERGAPGRGGVLSVSVPSLTATYARPTRRPSGRCHGTSSSPLAL
jgi:hypothetical protein